MNIVAINGSPTGPQGATGRLLAALADGAARQAPRLRCLSSARSPSNPATAAAPASRSAPVS